MANPNCTFLTTVTHACLCAGLALAGLHSVPTGAGAQSLTGDAWMAGGAVFRTEPKSADEITPWVEWQGTLRQERFAVHGTLSFADRALIRDVVLADATPIARATAVGSDLAIGLRLRGDLQLLGRGTIVSGAATAPLVPAEDGTLIGLFLRGEGGLNFMPDSQEFWDYRVGGGVQVANSAQGGSIAFWVGRTGRLDDVFDVSAISRGGVTLEYISPPVLWPRLFLRVDGSKPFHDRADVEDVPGLAGERVTELELSVGLVVPLIPKGL